MAIVEASLNPYLNEALQFVMHRKKITARDLADDTQVEISPASHEAAQFV